MKIVVRNDFTLEVVHTREVPQLETSDDLHRYLEKIEKIANKKDFRSTWVGRYQLVIFRKNISYSIYQANPFEKN